MQYQATVAIEPAYLQELLGRPIQPLKQDRIQAMLFSLVEYARSTRCANTRFVFSKISPPTKQAALDQLVRIIQDNMIQVLEGQESPAADKLKPRDFSALLWFGQHAPTYPASLGIHDSLLAGGKLEAFMDAAISSTAVDIRNGDPSPLQAFKHKAPWVFVTDRYLLSHHRSPKQVASIFKQLFDSSSQTTFFIATLDHERIDDNIDALEAEVKRISSLWTVQVELFPDAQKNETKHDRILLSPILAARFGTSIDQYANRNSREVNRVDLYLLANQASSDYLQDCFARFSAAFPELQTPAGWQALLSGAEDAED